jgi:hypothetical protein
VFKSLIPLVTAFALLMILGFSTRRSATALNSLQTDYDSTVARFENEQSIDNQLLQAGDSLPDIRLRTASGQTVALRDLPKSGLKYLYFYRPDCPPCEILDSVWRQVQTAGQDSTAFIAFHPDHDLSVEPGLHHFAWIHDSTSRAHFINRVPSLLVVDRDGRVVTAAQASLERVARVFDLYGILQRERVGSAVASAIRNAAVPGAPHTAASQP